MEVGMRCQDLNEAAGVILGASSQSRLSSVAVLDLAGGWRRNIGAETKIKPDKHKNSWKDFVRIQIVLVQAM